MDDDAKTYLPFNDCDEILPVLNKIAIFGGLTRAHLNTLCSRLERVQYTCDEFIFRQGDEPTHLYIVRSGEVKLITDVDDETLELADFREGDCFGETGIIGIQRHSASAIAVRDTELIVVSGEAFLSFYETDKELFSKLMLNIAREACRRLHKSGEVMLHYVHVKNGKEHKGRM